MIELRHRNDLILQGISPKFFITDWAISGGGNKEGKNYGRNIQRT